MKTFVIAWNMLRRLSHDWLTIFLIGTIPIIFILLFGYVFLGTPTHIRTALVNYDTGQIQAKTEEFGQVKLSENLSHGIIEGLDSKTLDLRFFQSLEEARKRLKDGRLWAVIFFEKSFSNYLFNQVIQIKGRELYQYEGSQVHLLPQEVTTPSPPIELYLDKSNYPVAQTVMGTVTNQIQKNFYNYLSEDGKSGALDYDFIQVNYVYGEEAGLLDYYAPGLIGFAVTIITSFLTLISMVREERNEILERILTFPVSPWEISLGYTLAFIIIGLLQALEVIVIAYFILGMMFMGSFFLLLLVIIIYIIGLQGLGTLLSTLAKNEFQAMQFTLLLIVPSVFLTGAFWPLESLHPVLRPLAWCIPLTYLNQALRSIMLRGWGLADIGIVTCALTLFALLMLGGSIWIMSRKRGHLV